MYVGNLKWFEFTLRLQERAGPIVHLKNFYRPKSLGTLWDEEICKKKIFFLA